MVEGTAVTESLHKWNTTPCTIASHKPELWCKCFSNMAWIYPCILRLKNAFFTSIKNEKPKKVVTGTLRVWGLRCTSCKQFQTMLVVFVNFPVEEYCSIVTIARAWVDDHICLPCCFTVSFWRQVYQDRLQNASVYWGADSGQNAFVLHSFMLRAFLHRPEELRFNSLWPWICRMALLRRQKGWTTFHRAAGRKQDGCVWHVALLMGEGCLSWPSGCQNWLPLIAPDRRIEPGHNCRASWFKSQPLTKTHHDHTLTD